MKKVAVITARGGSKRIPLKNIKIFCGKPIIAYSIETALKSGLFDEVMVSTDSEEIAEISRHFGASVPFLRSAETSNDYVLTGDVVKEVIREYEKRGKFFDYACCIYPTAPFITADRLKEAQDIAVRTESLSVYPVTEFSFPPQRGVYINENNEVSWVQPEHAETRSQDLRRIYHDCGQFYYANVGMLMKASGSQIVDSTSRAIIISQNETQDIDTPFDWDLAELKYRIINNYTEE